MTIIVYRDGVMAADTWVTAGDLVVGEAIKIIRNERGLWGGSGHLGDIGKFQQWAAHEGNNIECFKDLEFEDFFGLHVDTDGMIFYFDHCSNGVPTPIIADYAVCGGAQDVAMGALEVGASAVEAVKATARRVPGIGGHVVSLRLNGHEHITRERLEK